MVRERITNPDLQEMAKSFLTWQFDTKERIEKVLIEKMIEEFKEFGLKFKKKLPVFESYILEIDNEKYYDYMDYLHKKNDEFLKRIVKLVKEIIGNRDKVIKAEWFLGDRVRVILLSGLEIRVYPGLRGEILIEFDINILPKYMIKPITLDD